VVDQQRWIVLAVMAAALAAMGVSHNGGERQRDGTGGDLAGNGATGDEVEVIRSFFSHPSAADRTVAQRISEARVFDFDSIIATIPDPIDTSLDFNFDRHVESIQQALATHGYVLDRFWLPWIEIEKSGEIERRELLRKHYHHEHPGVLLFRADNGPAGSSHFSILAVFLVGETPTAGIHDRAFAKAMELIDAENLRSDPSKGTVIIGPTFSGSALSLDRAIRAVFRNDAHPRLHDGLNPLRRPFRVFTGSATAESNKRLLNITENGVVESQFFSAVHSNGETECALFDYLKKSLGIQPDRVAMLIESNTGFGQSFAVSPGPGQPAKHCENYDPKVTIPFPLHISKIRLEFERLRKKKESEAASTREAIPVDDRAIVNLAAEDSRDADDVVPIVSGVTKISSEQTLANILSDINRFEVKFVGIVATDPLDIVFLSDRVRTYCPGVQIFLLDSDNLFQHDEKALEGALIASTYAVTSETQRWTYPYFGQVRRNQFASNNAEGVFNAVLLALRPCVMEGDVCRSEPIPRAQAIPSPHPGTPIPPLDYAMPFQAADPAAASVSPPVWISAISNGAAWALKAQAPDPPAAYITPIEVAAGSAASPGATDVGAPDPHLPIPESYLLLLVVLAFVSLHHFVQLPRERPANDGSTWHRIVNAHASTASDMVSEGHEFDRELDRYVPTPLVDARLFALAIVVCVVSFPLMFTIGGEMQDHLGALFRGHHEHDQWKLAIWLLFALLATASQGCLVVTAFQAAQIRRNPAVPPNAMPLRQSWSSTIAWTGLATVVLLGLEVGGCLLWLRADRTAITLFILRAANLSSGLSPYVATLALAATLFAWFRAHLQRVAVTAKLQGDINMVSGTVTSWLSCVRDVSKDDVTELADLTMGRPRANARLYVWLTLMVPLIVQFFHSLRRPFDGFLWGLVFELLFLANVAIVVGACLRAGRTWWILEQVLGRLALQTGAETYKRVANILGPRHGFPLYRNFLYYRWRDILDKSRARVLTTLEASDKEPTKLVSRAAVILGARLEFNEPKKAAAAFLLGRELEGAPDSEGESSPVAEEALLDYFALRVAWLTSVTFESIRNFIVVALVGAMMLTVSAGSYPFFPQRFPLVIATVGILSVAVLATLLFVEIERDEIVSTIAGTKPGEIELNWTFVMHMALYVLLPILALLASSVPSVAEKLNYVITPLTRIFEH
jgi:hypothetical protein